MLPITKAFFLGSEVGLCYTGDALLRTTNATPFNHHASQQIPNHQNTLSGHEDDMNSKSSKVQLTESSAVYTKYALCALLGTPELKTVEVEAIDNTIEVFGKKLKIKTHNNEITFGVRPEDIKIISKGVENCLDGLL